MCMCRIRSGQSEEEGGSHEDRPGDNALALFDKCHSLFHVPTRTWDRRFNFPSEGQLAVHWCSVRRQGDYHTGS